jgi:hypothetical protein
VPAHRHQVDTVLLDVDRNLADGLGCVAMEDDTLLFRDLPDLRDRMNRADLVVGVHERDEHGLVGDRLAHGFRIDHPVIVDREIGDGRLAAAF